MEGLVEDDVKELNKELEKMTVPAQKKLVKELEEQKPSKRKSFLKKVLTDRKKLESDISRILEKVEKKLKEKKGAIEAFEMILKALEICEQLSDDGTGLKIAQKARSILNKADEDPELKNVVTNHRAKLLKDADDLNKNAQESIFKGEFFQAGVIYRKSARFCCIANDEELYNKYLSLAEDCDSQGTV